MMRSVPWSLRSDPRWCVGRPRPSVVVRVMPRLLAQRSCGSRSDIADGCRREGPSSLKATLGIGRHAASRPGWVEPTRWRLVQGRSLLERPSVDMITPGTPSGPGAALGRPQLHQHSIRTARWGRELRMATSRPLGVGLRSSFLPPAPRFAVVAMKFREIALAGGCKNLPHGFIR